MKVVVLVDGEHYPPVVRAAIDEMRDVRGWEIAAAVFLGGTEKIGGQDISELLGVRVHRSDDRRTALREMLAEHSPDAVIDLSDEPVLGPADRFLMASETLLSGAAYSGQDFDLRPIAFEDVLSKPAIRVIATGKRTGKTAVAGALARHAVAAGHKPVIVCMGRGGPPEPEVLEIDQSRDAASLLELADSGRHAASDHFEDALTSGVTTIGCRRVGGGLAGAPWGSNVVEGARIAEERAEDLVILEGSGASVPPVGARAGLVCVPAGAEALLRQGLNVYRLLLADVAVVTMADDPGAGAVESAVREISPDLQVVRAIFRPRPLSDVSDRKVFFACTAPERVGSVLVDHLREAHGCEVVGISHKLSDREALERDIADAPDHDVLLTEIKAGAIDVAVRAAMEAGREVVFADNEPQGEGLDEAFDLLIERAGAAR